MIAAAVLLASATTVPWLPGVYQFPGSYFDQQQADAVERQVLTNWPGPASLVEAWESGELAPFDRFRLLLGAGSFHDPQLLPVYRQGLLSGQEKLRQAAAWGYRRLLADATPAVENGVPPEAGRALAAELDVVAELLRSRSLVEMWLEVLLLGPDPRRLVLPRSRAVASRALEELVDVADLPDLERAWRATEHGDDLQVRATLLRLIEAASVREFYERPETSTGGRPAAWGHGNYLEAFHILEGWLDCRDGDALDGVAEILRLADGEPVPSPFAAEACDAWQILLQRGRARWMPVVARRLYDCGAPPARLSIFRADADDSRRARRRLMEALGLVR